MLKKEEKLLTKENQKTGIQAKGDRHFCEVKVVIVHLFFFLAR